jgi:hypothetical protein
MIGLCRYGYVAIAIVSTQNRRTLLPPPQYVSAALHEPSHRGWPGLDVYQHLWLQAQQARAKVVLLARSGRFDQRLRRLLRKRALIPALGALHGAVQVRIVRADKLRLENLRMHGAGRDRQGRRGAVAV